MAKTRLTLDGFDSLRKALANAPEVARAHASDAVGLSAFSVAQRARSLVPVDTGTLKESIEVTKTAGKSLVGRVGLATGAAAGYWFFVEFGTVHMAARPFFRPAAEAERDDFIRRMQAIGPKIERDLSAGRIL